MTSVLRSLVLFIAFMAMGISQVPGQILWIKDSHNPILSGGGAGAWDSDVQAPCVIFNADSGRYEMWYTGSLPSGGIGFGISNNGIAWTKNANRVLSPSPGTWDSSFVGIPCVMRENGQYKMWYSGARGSSGATGAFGARIGYATSPDGRNWVKHPGNPVLNVGPSSWESGAVAFCSVIKNGGGYSMFYTGSPLNANLCRIGRATSSDGITWQRDTLHNPVLNIGTGGAWDGNIYLPAVLNHGGAYYLWYTAEAVPGDNHPSIGQATSTDSGKTWVKYPTNPVLTPGTLGTWDERWVELGSVLSRGDTVQMWYDAGAPPGFLSRVGRATAVVSTGVSETPRGVPDTYMLSQNYPNPFNPTTVLSYQLSVASDVRLVVCDLLGREVAVLVSERKAPGSYEVTFDAAGLASGVYLYRLTAGNFVQTRKMLLLH